MSQQIVIFKAGQTVPAENVLAHLARHLRTAGVSLDGDGAHRAPLDVLPLPPVLSTGEAGVPGGGAEAAELLDTGGTGDGHPLGLGAAVRDVADGVAASTGAPRPVGVQRDLFV